MNDQQPTSSPEVQQPGQAPADTAKPIDAQPQAPALSPNNPKKLRMILFVCIGILVVLGAVAAIVYFMFFYVSKADYKSAETQTNTTLTAYHKADAAAQAWSAAVTDVSSTDSEIATKKTTYDSANSAYVSAVNKLSGMRALRDGKVKTAYNAFVTKNTAAMANNDSIAESMPTVRTLVVQCNGADTSGVSTSDLSTIAAAWDKAFAGCTSAIKSLSSAKNADVAAVGKKLESYFSEMRTDIVALQNAYIAKDEAAFTKAYTAFTDVEDKYSADTSLQNIQKHQDSLEPLTEINSLITVIRARE